MPDFQKLISHPTFCNCWGVLVVDEAHLADEWGADFQPLYKDIWSLHSRGPEHLTVVALSASIEPGRQYHNVVKHLGFMKCSFYLDKRDCERQNVSLTFREAKYPCSGFVFRDLDYLIPSDMTNVIDTPKQLLYCETIEVGHCVATYCTSAPSSLWLFNTDHTP